MRKIPKIRVKLDEFYNFSDTLSGCLYVSRLGKLILSRVIDNNKSHNVSNFDCPTDYSIEVLGYIMGPIFSQN